MLSAGTLDCPGSVPVPSALLTGVADFSCPGASVSGRGVPATLELGAGVADLVSNSDTGYESAVFACRSIVDCDSGFVCLWDDSYMDCLWILRKRVKDYEEFQIKSESIMAHRRF